MFFEEDYSISQPQLSNQSFSKEHNQAIFFKNQNNQKAKVEDPCCSQILLDDFPNSKTEKSAKQKSSTKGTSRKQQNKVAAQKYRQRRKEYAKQLQNNVTNIQRQIINYQNQIKSYRQKVQVLMNSTKYKDQHAETYAQLKSQAHSDQPNLDKINLLLDTLKYRIGANGRERQAKIDYNFKQIINTIFPALHRYLMYTAKHQKDIFKNEQSAQNLISSASNKNYLISWTNELFQMMQLKQQQEIKIKKLKQKLVKVRFQTLEEIQNLIKQKQKLKIQQQSLENVLDEIRQEMHPLQSANLTLFCEKHKYRRQLFLQSDFGQTNQQEFQNRIQGRKIIKTQSNS